MATNYNFLRAQKAAALARSQGLADMEAETKAFTSTDPATRATAPGAGLATGPQIDLTGQYKIQPKAPAIDLTGAYKIQPKAMTDQDYAREAVAQSQARMDELYRNTQGLASHLDQGTVDGLERNAINAPTAGVNATQRGLANAYNGGGHMGGYGDAAFDVNRQMAQAQRDTNMNQLHADIGKYQDTFDANKAGLLNSIRNADPTFANYDNLYTQGQNFANQDRAFNADMSHYETDRQDRLNQQGNANQASFIGGLGSAAGGILSNPAAMGAIGSIGGPIGTGAGVVASAIYNGLGLAKPPAPAPVQSDTPAPIKPRYSVASVPGHPILGGNQAKPYGLFRSV